MVEPLQAHMQLWVPVLSDDGGLNLKTALTVTEIQLWASRRVTAATGRHAEVLSFLLLFYCGVCLLQDVQAWVQNSQGKAQL